MLIKPKPFSFGLLQAWFWLAFGQGLCNPIEQKGYLIGVVAITFCSAGLCLLLISLLSSKCTRVFENKAATIGVAAVAAVASLVLSLTPITTIPPTMAWLAALLVGPCSAWLLLLCGKTYKGLKLRQLFFYIFATVFIVFLVYFSTVSLPQLAQAIIFALLPLLTASLLVFGLDDNQANSTASPKLDDSDLLTGTNTPIASSQLRIKMIVSFGVYFCTISMTRSASLSDDDGMAGFAADTGIALVIVAALVLAMLLINYTKDNSVFFMRAFYIAVALAEVFTVIPQSLGIEDFVLLRHVANITFFLSVLVAWYCVAADTNINNVSPVRIFGLSFGVWALLASAGWLLQNAIEQIIIFSDTMLIFLVGQAIVRLACFLFIFPDSALVRFISAPILKNPLQDDGAGQLRSLSFKEAVKQIGEQAKLSQREQEILLLLAKGRNNQNIAEELVLSFHTVRAHIRNAYVKLDIHNRQELLDLIERTRKIKSPLL
jgi:DNA-binding CsgD family transcriptional regulator